MDARSNTRPIQILRLPEVCKTTGLGRSMVYQLEAEQRFPARVRISERAVGWVEEEVQGWLTERIQRSRRPSV
jgi:predicted DNA-binding transcriptional regulator AlpA